MLLLTDIKEYLLHYQTDLLLLPVAEAAVLGEPAALFIVLDLAHAQVIKPVLDLEHVSIHFLCPVDNVFAVSVSGSQPALELLDTFVRVHQWPNTTGSVRIIVGRRIRATEIALRGVVWTWDRIDLVL